jgi:hypothetical protein
MNETLIGAGIIGLGAIYLFIKFKEGNANGKKSDPFTLAFTLFLFAIFTFCFFLIGKVAVESNDYCEIVVNSTRALNSTYDVYDYARVCFSNSSDSANGLFILTNTFIIISGLFLLALLFWIVWLYIKSLYETYLK